MEISFNELKQKETVNIKDGKRLGKAVDLVFCQPEGKIIGIVVPGGKSCFFNKGELFIDWRSIVKIGEDTVLVDIAPALKPLKNGRRNAEAPPPAAPNQPGCRRSYDEYE